MGLVVGKGAGHAGKHVLEAFAGQQVAVLEGDLAEFGQIGIARGVDLDLVAVDHAQLGRAVPLRLPPAQPGFLGKFHCFCRGHAFYLDPLSLI